MASVNERLVRRDDRLALLLTPPFDTMEPSPGYIRGYLPGVRENGGQYTHAALWNVLAFARSATATAPGAVLAAEPRQLHPHAGAGRPLRAEPYVVAADVYSVPPHTGRGGWTWYTGSAGWMYRVGIEAILGVTLRAAPRAPHRPQVHPARAWPGFEVVCSAGKTQRRTSCSSCPLSMRLSVVKPPRVLTVRASSRRSGLLTSREVAEAALECLPVVRSCKPPGLTLAGPSRFRQCLPDHLLSVVALGHSPAAACAGPRARRSICSTVPGGTQRTSERRAPVCARAFRAG
jgi:hypothetical protein